MDTKTSRLKPKTPPTTRALARLSREAPFVALFNYALYETPRDEVGAKRLSVADRLAISVTAGDVIWPSPSVSLDMLKVAPRELTAREIAANKFLRSIRDAMATGMPLRVFVFVDGTVVLNNAAREEPRVGSFLWLTIIYESARRGKHLAAITAKTDAEAPDLGSVKDFCVQLVTAEAERTKTIKRAKGVA